MDIRMKTVEEIIGYWIEMEHINRSVYLLEEYADEVGEIYEGAAWLTNNTGKHGRNVMDVRDSLSEASELTLELLREAEEKLKTVLGPLIETSDQYGHIDVTDKMDDIMDCLSEDYDEIYEYEQEKQLGNFYRVLQEIVDRMIGNEMT